MSLDKMIIGIGIDILNIQRIRSIYVNPDDPFFISSFSEKESREASGHRDPVIYFSTRFAGKEAVIKSIGIDESIRLREIEIVDTETGRPTVSFKGQVKGIAEEKGIKKVIISLSSDGDYAVAFAIAEN
jgi:phosphopantetheine--protein transferase-like protein